MDVFDEIIDVGASLTNKFAKNKLAFGDGYSQTSPLGLKNVQQSWSIAISNNEIKILEIREFLNARRGVTPFKWVNPLGDEITVKVTSLSVVGPDEGGNYTLAATFEQEV